MLGSIAERDTASFNLALRDVAERAGRATPRDMIFALALSRPPHLNDARPPPR